jgi:hypothetical protein
VQPDLGPSNRPLELVGEFFITLLGFQVLTDIDEDRNLTYGSGQHAQHFAIHMSEGRYLERLIPHIPAGFSLVSDSGTDDSNRIAYLVVADGTRSGAQSGIAGHAGNLREFRLYALEQGSDTPSYIGSMTGLPDTDSARYEIDWLPGRRDVSFFLAGKLWVVPVHPLS